MIGTGSPRSVRPDKVTLIAVWFGISAAFSLFVAVTSVLMLLGILLPEIGNDPEAGMVTFGLSSGVFLFSGLGVLNIAAVVGVLQLREWGRWLAMVLAIMGLIFIPIGTIVGVFIIRYLLTDEATQAFGAAIPPSA
jgi:hypothetical protein